MVIGLRPEHLSVAAPNATAQLPTPNGNAPHALTERRLGS
jgi:hypothetical protein